MRIRFVRDPIHQNILLSELDVMLLDTQPMQRLRYVHQTGLVYLVYPGATHTRFEHSIGVRYLAEQILNTIKIYGAEIPRDEEEVVKVAALLHDVAHPAFSHSLDRIVGEESHEEHALRIMRESEISDLLSSHGIDVNDVWKVISRGRGLGGIVRGDIDADRLDYLRRDAYYTGVAYGVIDTRILMEFRLHGGEVVLSQKGLRPAESVLFARYLMYTTVYNHKTVRIAASMLSKAVREAVKAGALKVEDLYRLRDHQLLATLASLRGIPGDYARRLEERRLFKLAYRASWDEVPRDLLKELVKIADRPKRVERLEEELAGSVGAGFESVIVDIPTPPMLEEAEVKILYNGQATDIKRLSPLADSLTAAYRRAWSFAVYTLPELREKVGKAAAGLFKSM